MEKVTVYYHKETDTLDVWFGNPEEEYICEEIGSGIILKKDKEGKVLGFERLYVKKFMGLRDEISSIPVEVVMD